MTRCIPPPWSVEDIGAAFAVKDGTGHFEDEPGRQADLIKTSQEKTVKLKLIFVCLAIALAQITPLNAQAVSPPGHYSKKSGGAGEMAIR